MLKDIYPRKCDGKLKEKRELLAEEKYDGHRALLHIGLDLDRGYLTSGNKSTVTGRAGENGLNVPQIAESAQTAAVRCCLKYTIFDGEIQVPGYPFEAVQSVMGSLPEVAIKWQLDNERAIFKVFDILFYNGKDVRDKPLWRRKEMVGMAMHQVNRDAESPTSSCLHEVLGYYGRLQENFLVYFEEIVSEGGEGMVIKDTDAPYGTHWFKWKKEETYDVVVAGFTEGTGKYRGMFGAVEFGIYIEGELRVIGRCSGMEDGFCRWIDEEGNETSANALKARLQPLPVVDGHAGPVSPPGSRVWFHQNRKALIGSTMEVKCNGLTRHRKLRHPQFVRMRPDKPAKHCLAP